MKLTKISNLSFMSKIIDTHAHVGTFEGKILTKEHTDIFIKSELPNKDTIEKMFISDLDILYSSKDEYTGNVELLNLLKDNAKYEPIASCSPADGNVSKIRKLFDENPDKFIGLKFHPSAKNLSASSPKYEPYMKFAEEKGLVCLFHSAVLTDNTGKALKDALEPSDPRELYKLAKKFKDVPIIMAHLGAGWREAHDIATDVLIESVKNGDANLYADISWVDIDSPLNHKGHKSKEHIINAIKQLKGIGDSEWKYGDQSFRLLFGSDVPIVRFSENDARNIYADFVEDIKFAIRNDKDLKHDAENIINNLFYKNADNLYLSSKTPNAHVSPSTPLPPPIPPKKRKIWLWIGAGAAFATIITALITKSKKSEEPKIK